MSSRRRKVQMSMWKGGNRRRSPRISGLNAACEVQTMEERVEVCDNAKSTTADRVNGPASRTRARKKRKLRPLQDVAAATTCVSSPITHQSQDADTNGVEQGEEQNHEREPSNSDKSLVVRDDSHQDQPSSLPSAPWMPEKRVLELILDVLQRKDTHEIFAEPVDPEEVEDYYEIIREPMDFGTMRAKLHEGMYTSLEQFEHDIFLISENAMHFNSSGTIYFRQARIINELSKKVFHALKTDPDNFESEFSETRRRTSRRPQSEAKGPINSSSPKSATNLRTNSITVNISSKTVPYSLGGPTILRRSIQGNPECSRAASPLSARENEMLSGARSGRRTSFAEADRRSTYIPWSSFLNDNDSIVSSIYNHSKTLKPMNQQDIGYRESLMLFVRDLGPAVQMIARRKLQGWSTEASKFQTSSSNYLLRSPQLHNSMDNTFGSIRSQNLQDRHQIRPQNSSDKTDLCDNVKGGKAYTGNGMDIHPASVEAIPNNQKKIPFAFKVDICTPGDKVHESGNNVIMSGSNSSAAVTRELNFSIAGLKDKGSLSVAMISDKSKLDNRTQPLNSTSEHSPSDMLKFSLRNDHSSSSQWPLQTTSMSTSQPKGSRTDLGSSQCFGGDHQAIAAQGQRHDLTGDVFGASQHMPLVSQFTFDLPYLKTRLDQINASPHEKLLQQYPGTGKSFLDKMSYQNLDNHQQSSLDPKHTDLVLQL